MNAIHGRWMWTLRQKNSYILPMINFFHSLGVDILKIQIEEKMYQIPEEEGISAAKIYRCFFHFLIRGNFLTIPNYQKELYGDEEVFGKQFPKDLTVIQMPEDEQLPTFDIDGWNCVFKHPCFRFETEEFQTWDCGYVLGSILMMKDLG